MKTNKFDFNHAENYRNSPMVTRSCKQQESPVSQPRGAANETSNMDSLEQEVKYIKCLFKIFQNKLYEADARNRVIMEWRVVAQVLDRILFSIYIVTVVVSCSGIFYYAQQGSHPGNCTKLADF